MNKLLPILLGLFLSTLAVWALVTSNGFIHGTLESLDNLGYDVQLKTYLLTKKPMPSSAIAIVDIDDKSLNAEGHWPWPRSKLAELTDQLTKNGAVVVAFDMFFSENQQSPVDKLMDKVDAAQLNDRNVINFLKEMGQLFDRSE